MTLEGDSDQQLIASYQVGDEVALEILIKRYLGLVYNLVYRYVNSGSDAEDITQEVFIKVWKNLPKFDQHKNFKIWLTVIARHTALDWLKKKKLLLFSSLEDENGHSLIEDMVSSDLLSAPNELYDQEQRRARLSAAVNHLATKYRLVLFLHYNGHLTFQEIAEVLGEPLDTVKSRNRRALIKLRELLYRKDF